MPCQCHSIMKFNIFSRNVSKNVCYMDSYAQPNKMFRNELISENLQIIFLLLPFAGQEYMGRWCLNDSNCQYLFWFDKNPICCILYNYNMRYQHLVFQNRKSDNQDYGTKMVLDASQCISFYWKVVTVYWH